MGKVISTLGRKALKPIKNYNAEERAYKVISREKPKPAPRHAINMESPPKISDEG